MIMQVCEKCDTLGIEYAPTFAAATSAARHGHPRVSPRDALRSFVGREIFGVTGLPNLDALDGLLDDSRFLRKYREFQDAASRRASSQDSRPLSVVDIFGQWGLEDAALAAALERGVLLRNAWRRARTQLAEYEAVNPPRQPRIPFRTPEVERRSRFLWFVTDTAVPAAVSEAWLGYFQSEIAIIALDAGRVLGTDRSKLVPLGERWGSFLRVFLAYVAALPGVDIGDVIPPGERLDLDAIERAHVEADRNYHERHGIPQSVYQQ